MIDFALMLARLFERANVQAARLAGLGLLLLTAVIMYDVVGRRFFDTGSVVLQDLEWHLHGAIAVLGFGYAYTRDAHVRIDIFRNRIGRRTRLVLELGAILVFLVPFLLLLIRFGYDFTARSFARGEGAAGLGMDHRWIIKSAVPVSAVLTLLGALSVALRAGVALAAPHRLADPFVQEGLWKR